MIVLRNQFSHNLKIIISLTTISSRINRIHQVIKSLLANDVSLLKHNIIIVLYISSNPYLLDKGITNIPSDLLSLAKDHTIRSSKISFKIENVQNCGPHRKYIFNKLNDDDLMITVDDDTIYPNNFIYNMVKAMETYDCVIATRGRKIITDNLRIAKYRSWDKKNFSNKPHLNNVGTGKDGIAYKLNHLHPNVWNIEAALKFAPRADDLWLKAHSLLQGIPTRILTSSLEDEFTEIGDPLSKISLFNEFNKKGGNDKALENIDSYLTTQFQTTLYHLIMQ